MRFILFDQTSHWKDLLPLTYTRSISDLRVGILTIKEKWEKSTGYNFEVKTMDYLQAKYGEIPQTSEELVIINAGATPSQDLITAISNIELGQHYSHNDQWIVSKIKASNFNQFSPKEVDLKEISITVNLIEYPEHIFQTNEPELQSDFDLITKDRISQTISDTNQLINKENIFLEEGASVECSIMNASKGPIYIGKNAEIMEGSIIRGGLSLLPHAKLKLGTKVYGASTIGQYSKVGGEINNVVIQGFSNKGHDGFLGNSVIGEWCNLGADTNSSNLKNNYSEVRLWNHNSGSFRKIGTQFCGLIMGDHSKCGINTMFNTGTVIGVGSNVFGSGYPRNFIPSFSWGGKSGFMTNRLNKTIEVAEIVLKRRSKILSEIDKNILLEIFNSSALYRTWDNK